jgi:hypothetical protein
MPASSLRRLVVALVVGVGLLGGCSSTEMTLGITAKGDVNGGRPFYAVVRAVDQGTHVTDTYESIAGKVFANPPDPTVIKTAVIYPGVEQQLKFKKPEGLPVGVYFLFTSPSDKWKILRPQPLASATIELGANGVFQVVE